MGYITAEEKRKTVGEQLLPFVESFLLLITVYKLSGIPTFVMQGMRCSAIALLLILNFQTFARVPSRRMALFSAFSIAIPLCTIAAGGDLENVLYAFVQGLNIIALFISVNGMNRRMGIFGTLDVLFWSLLVLSFANDLSVFTSSSNVSTTTYLIGNKFSTGDIHILLTGIYAALLAYKHGYVRYNWGIFWALVVESSAVLIKANAMTSLLSYLLATAVVVFLPKKACRVLTRGPVVVGTILIINAIYFGTGMLLNVPWVQYFIQGVLGRSLTMTGRTPIYNVLGIIIGEKPLFGWGYGNSIVRQVVGWGNAQNGLAEIVVNYGIVGAIAFSISIMGALDECGQAHRKYTLPMIGIVYGTILASLVEISFGLSFFLSLSIITSALFEKKNTAKYERTPAFKEEVDDGLTNKAIAFDSHTRF